MVRKQQEERAIARQAQEGPRPEAPYIRSAGDEKLAALRHAEAEAEERHGDEEEEDEYRALQEARLRALREHHQRIQESLSKGHGQYREIVEEEFLGEVTKSKLAVVHFYHREFEKCKVMDKHLREMAERHITTKFVHLDAEKAPFFVGKLAVRTLPTLLLFRDGVLVDRVVGFEGLGGVEDFSTRALERRLAEAEVLDAAVVDSQDLGDSDSDGEETARRNMSALRVSSVHDYDSDESI